MDDKDREVGMIRPSRAYGHNESGIYFKAALSLPTVCAGSCHSLTGGLRVTPIIISVIVLGLKLSILCVLSECCATELQSQPLSFELTGLEPPVPLLH